MSEMVERVALALCESGSNKPCEAACSDCQDDARAAISAMRDLTVEMHAKGAARHNSLSLALDRQDAFKILENVEEIWVTMINSALEPTP